MTVGTLRLNLQAIAVEDSREFVLVRWQTLIRRASLLAAI